MAPADTLANFKKFLILLDPSLNLQEMLTNVARQLVEMFEVDHSGMLLFDEDDLEGRVIAEYPSQGAVGLTVSLTDYPLHNQLIAKKKPIAVHAAQHDPVMGSVRLTMQRLDIQSIVIIPLVAQNRVVGSLSLDAISKPRTFTPEEIDLCDIIGDQIGVAVDYTRSLELAEANRRQAQILRDVNHILSQSLNLDEILPLILEQLEKVLPADGSSIFLLVEGGIQLRAFRGAYNPFVERQTIPPESLWGANHIVKTKTPILVQDTQEHSRWNKYEGSPIRSWMGVPLNVRGEVVGILNIDGYSPGQFNSAHLDLIHAFADQAAIAIHNARLYSQAEKRADQLASVQEIGLGLVSSLELREVLQAITTSVLTLLEAAQAQIYLYDSETDAFALVTTSDKDDQMDLNFDRPQAEGLTATVARTGRYLAVPNVLEHPLYREEVEPHGFKAIIGVPLGRQDDVLGVLNVFYEQPHNFTLDEINLLYLLANQAAVALENARLYSLEQTRLQDEARRSKQWQRVQQITSTLNASLDLEQVLNNACRQFVQFIEVDHCGVLLMNEDGQSGRVVAEYPKSGATGLEIPLNFPAFEQMRRDHKPYASFDVAEDPNFGEALGALEAVGVKSVLIAPLVAQNQVIGSIGLDATQSRRRFTEEELNITRIVADQMAIAITNARTYQAERTARIQADTLQEATATLNETLDLNKVLVRILAQLQRVIICDSSSIILRDQDKFRVVAARGFNDPDQVVNLTFTLADRPHIQEIIRTRRPLVIPDTELYGWQQKGPTTIRSWIGAPLIVSDKLIGLLAVDHAEPNFYTQADGDLITSFADLAAIALENARLYEFEVKQIEQELEIARQIQKGFFPQQIPQLPGWQIAAVCRPAGETGGDFYEFVERPDGLLGLVVGDVSGKSIQAAMLMAAAQSLVNAKGSDYRSPASVMAETNRLLCQDVPTGSFVALSYAVLRPDDNAVCLSNAGQLDPFLVPADSRPIQLIDTPGSRLPLGILSNVNYQEMPLTVAPGDLLVFYTDGVVERKDSSRQLFGFERVAAVLEGVRGHPPQIALDTLLRAADSFGGEANQDDDITLVVAQRIAG